MKLPPCKNCIHAMHLAKMWGGRGGGGVLSASEIEGETEKKLPRREGEYLDLCLDLQSSIPPFFIPLPPLFGCLQEKKSCLTHD